MVAQTCFSGVYCSRKELSSIDPVALTFPDFNGGRSKLRAVWSPGVVGGLSVAGYLRRRTANIPHSAFCLVGIGNTGIHFWNPVRLPSDSVQWYFPKVVCIDEILQRLRCLFLVGGVL